MDTKVIVLLFGTLIFRFILDGVEGIVTGREEKQRHSAVTAKTTYGEIYDCIDIDKQPSLQHPALAGHQVEISPGKKYVDALIDGSYKYKRNATKSKTIWLGKPCPFGTVPIPRAAQKQRGRVEYPSPKDLNRSLAYNGGLEFAGITVRNGGDGYYGAAAHLDIHKPINVNSHQYSAASVILENGNNQIQCGWIVHPDLYGDANTRLYTHWKNDNQGCYNTNCAGFIIVSEEFPLNYAFPHISDPNTGEEHEVIIKISQINDYGNWWFSVDDNILGYWPGRLFTSLVQPADTVRFGGQVYSQPPSDSSPPMGSGRFRGDNPYRTAYMQQVRVVLKDNSYVPPSSDLIQRVDSRCYFEGYDSYSSGILKGFHFLYGGKGGKAGVICLGKNH